VNNNSGCPEQNSQCFPSLAPKGAAGPGPHDHVLRNHSEGSRCKVAVSGPRFTAVMRIRVSSTSALRTPQTRRSCRRRTRSPAAHARAPPAKPTPHQKPVAHGEVFGPLRLLLCALNLTSIFRLSPRNAMPRLAGLAKVEKSMAPKELTEQEHQRALEWTREFLPTSGGPFPSGVPNLGW
jgi:hypothetical protein